MEPLDFPQVDLGFQTPCEHRKGYKPGANEIICMLVTERTGFCHAVSPMDCAKCRIDGPPNQAYIDTLVNGSFKRHLSYAFYNIHKDEQVILGVFKRFCTENPSDADKKVIVDHLLGCVSKSRITAENAAMIARDNLKMDLTALPRLEVVIAEAKARGKVELPPM